MNKDILAVIDDRWAIIPERLGAIIKVMMTASATIKQSNVTEKDQADFNVRDGIAIIPIHGVLMKDPGFFAMLFGATSMKEIGRIINAAIGDPNVKGILLDIDSPGGTVDGTNELARTVFTAKDKKPIVAFANGLMASAAYWVGSAADFIMTEPTGEVGSIGVYQMHMDRSKADEMAGIKRTLIKAGKYKAAGNDSQPLDRETEDYLQAGVDYVYSLFVDAVARYRAMPVSEVLAVADGQILIGEQALQAELVDEIGHLDDAIAKTKYLVTRFQMFK